METGTGRTVTGTEEREAVPPAVDSTFALRPRAAAPGSIVHYFPCDTSDWASAVQFLREEVECEQPTSCSVPLFPHSRFLFFP